jgi:hypothetical protein
MAPETIEGFQGNVNYKKADIWELGVTFYTLTFL